MSFSFLSFIDQCAKRHGGLSEMGEMNQQVESIVHHYLETVRPNDVVSPFSRPCLYLAMPARFRFRPILACSRPGGAVALAFQKVAVGLNY
jgi:hypothetical protein